MSQKTKNQHYVPRFLLRNWSRDERKRSIAMFLLANGKRHNQVSIEGQCAGRYFYGEDGELERSFAAEEGEVSLILRDLSPEYLDTLSDKELLKLLKFVHYQRQRTLAVAVQINAMVDAWTKNLLKPIIAQHPFFTEKDLDLIEVSHDEPQQLAMYQALIWLPFLLELEIKFLVTDRSPGFVISDNPVIAYNQFMEHHPRFRRYRGTTGIAVKGFQMFLPVSPNVCIAVFDHSTYQLGSPKSRVCKPSTTDIRLLNSMQAVNAFNSLYFDPGRIDDVHLALLGSAREKHPKLRVPEIENGPMRQRPDGLWSQFNRYMTPELRIGSQFNFSKVTDRRSYGTYQGGEAPPLRSREIYELADRHREQVDKMRDRAEQERTGS